MGQEYYNQATPLTNKTAILFDVTELTNSYMRNSLFSLSNRVKPALGSSGRPFLQATLTLQLLQCNLAWGIQYFCTEQAKSTKCWWTATKHSNALLLQKKNTIWTRWITARKSSSKSLVFWLHPITHEKNSFSTKYNEFEMVRRVKIVGSCAKKLNQKDTCQTVKNH